MEKSGDFPPGSLIVSSANLNNLSFANNSGISTVAPLSVVAPSSLTTTSTTSVLSSPPPVTKKKGRRANAKKGNHGNVIMMDQMGGKEEKKICLWETGNGATCGKTFAKMDSLKRHLAEAHKGNIKGFIYIHTRQDFNLILF